MGDKTGISWTHKTWNPIVGCSLLSPGCTNCYAMGDAHRIAQHPGKPGDKYRGLTTLANGRPVWNGVVRPAGGDVLTQPARWRKPALIFVNSMSDLFHEGLAESDVFAILDAIAAAPWHVYQILTKRARRMVEIGHAWLDARGLDAFPANVWMGMSIEDQKRLDERAPFMAELRAEVRWFSCEPLLGPVDMAPALAAGTVGWIVVGGESLPWARRAKGEKARPFDVAWARGIKAACEAAGAAFFFKQLGENPVGAARVTAKGDTEAEWPADLRVQAWPAQAALIAA